MSEEFEELMEKFDSLDGNVPVELILQEFQTLDKRISRIEELLINIARRLDRRNDVNVDSPIPSRPFDNTWWQEQDARWNKEQFERDLIRRWR